MQSISGGNREKIIGNEISSRSDETFGKFGPTVSSQKKHLAWERILMALNSRNAVARTLAEGKKSGKTCAV
jgi:ribosomal protein L20A (L18A)